MRAINRSFSTPTHILPSTRKHSPPIIRFSSKSTRDALKHCRILIASCSSKAMCAMLFLRARTTEKRFDVASQMRHVLFKNGRIPGGFYHDHRSLDECEIEPGYAGGIEVGIRRVLQFCRREVPFEVCHSGLQRRFTDTPDIVVRAGKLL